MRVHLAVKETRLLFRQLAASYNSVREKAVQSSFAKGQSSFAQQEWERASQRNPLEILGASGGI
jgi:hypothetical protein